jgi:aconitate hydratase
VRYQKEGVPLLVIAGKEYGSGSSRDWAAKGPLLLGVRAAIAGSFERIHRTNLVGMGILPLQFMPGENLDILGLTGRETFSISGTENGLTPRMPLTVTAFDEKGKGTAFMVTALLNTENEVETLLSGGILQKALRRMVELR